MINDAFPFLPFAHSPLSLACVALAKEAPVPINICLVFLTFLYLSK